MPLTTEQQQFADHGEEAFVEACPGAGKTRTVVARLARIAENLPPRKGIAILSFTNSAVDEFIGRCRAADLHGLLKHPGFVGTFDSFVRHFFIAPAGIPGVDIRPTIVDSWDSLHVEVRLRGHNAFRGDGVSLDKFDPVNNRINPVSIGHTGLRQNVAANQPAYERAAEQRRRGLRQNGYLSVADVRVEALRRLQDANWSLHLCRGLAARFDEVVVDEAQDCNPLDLQILGWLRSHALRVVIVCDPDQAIYGFRQGDPGNLRQFAESYLAANRLRLTGNFRSTEPICTLASTLRTRLEPDEPKGPNAPTLIPVQILDYADRGVPCLVDRLTRVVERYGISLDDTIVLAHIRRVASQAAGFGSPSDNRRNSRIGTLARAVCAFHSSSVSTRTREAALHTIEIFLLGLMGKIEKHESAGRAAEKHGIEKRWLRRTALELLMNLPSSCDDTDAARGNWITTLHASIDRLGLDYAPHVSPRRYFVRPQSADWSQDLRQSSNLRLPYSTIHEAKGREYDAVCIVLPPDRRDRNHTGQLFDLWENRIEDEAKRVVYVGITRAMKLVAIAVPTAFSPRLIDILNNAGVKFESG